MAIAATGLLVFILLKYKLSDSSERQRNSVVMRLNNNPAFIPELEKFPEYFRQRNLFYTMTNGNAEQSLESEIYSRYPGETGRVIVQLAKTWFLYKNELEKEKRNSRHEYEYLVKMAELKQQYFGLELSRALYPENDMEKIRLFYSYCGMYLQQNQDLPAEEKSVAVEKMRKKIYGNNFQRIVYRQNLDEELALQMAIMQKELSVMNPAEKESFIKNTKEKLKNNYSPY